MYLSLVTLVKNGYNWGREKIKTEYLPGGPRTPANPLSPFSPVNKIQFYLVVFGQNLSNISNLYS